MEAPKTEVEDNGWTLAAGHRANWSSLVNIVSAAKNVRNEKRLENFYSCWTERRRKYILFPDKTGPQPAG